MPYDKRTGLKIGGDRSHGGMNPPQSPDFNISEAVPDHLDRKWYNQTEWYTKKDNRPRKNIFGISIMENYS